MISPIDALAGGVLSAAELSSALQVSPPTMMRRLRDTAGRVVRIGKARATRYGLRRDVSGIGSELPVYRIDAAGSPALLGYFVSMAADQTAWLPRRTVHDGLPPVLFDMRPSGYMGRSFPQRHADLRLPPSVSDWSSDHVLVALARRGDDFTGDLVVGDESMERWFQDDRRAVTRDQYPERARAATAGEPPGSSAGGERPKFGAYVEGTYRLVKFAAAGDDAAATRWRDLLRLEQHALDVLRDGGVPAAEAALIETPSHLFLELVRFDRIGARGRRGAVTLAAAGGDLSASWAQVASRMYRERQISKDDAERLQLYNAFAQLIANVDRHHGNVVLFPMDGEHELDPTRYTLAPAFDQLPTLYAPTSDGQLPERAFDAPSPRADTWAVWDRAQSLARTFWNRAAEDGQLSDAMRAIVTRSHS